MPDIERETDGIDWSLTTWEGARREQLRRWAALPLERIIVALEEMQELAEQFGQAPETGKVSAASSVEALVGEAHAARQPPAAYGPDGGRPESASDGAAAELADRPAPHAQEPSPASREEGKG